MAFQPFSPWIPPSIASSSISQRPNFSTREEFFNNVPDSSRSSTDSTWLNAQQYTKTLSPRPQDYSNWKAKGLSPTQPHEILPPKFSSPFLPGLDVGPWSPPATQHQGRGFQGRSTPDAEERLVLADAKIQQLTLENRRLRQFIVNNYKDQQTSPPLESTLLEMKDSLSDSTTISNSSFRQGHQHITDAFRADPFAEEDSSTEKSVYSAPQVVVHSVVQGTFNFATMPTYRIRAIVWTLAYCQPKNNHESTGLKTAVKALTARFGVSDSSEPSAVLTKSIIDWAKPLCYTSCGNYLCQQLLERGTLEDKKAFLNQISDDIVPIASNKFGTHVLCKAINLKELEEPVAGALFKYGVYESMQTGARRLWREKSAVKPETWMFSKSKVNREMVGRWADLACTNETCEAIINSYPPVATTHHGVNLAKIALTEGGRASFVKYVEAICRQDDGRTPGIVTIATSSIGKAHLTFVMSCVSTAMFSTRKPSNRFQQLTPSEHVRSGNDLLRALGIMHSTSTKHRNAGICNV
ncbi:hypothetical protein D1P53_003852 [Cryptococcus gattii VGV]|nr:hypothetical protein D1P53_003852 [Cryptococcus gattii VGV]